MSGLSTYGATLRRALLLSVCAVALLVVGEGLLLLPALLDQIRHVPPISIQECALRDQGASALSLIRVCPYSTNSAYKFVLGWHDLSIASPDVRIAFAGVDPVSAMAASADELVVIAGGSASGSIYTIDLSQSPASARLLGRQTDGHAIALAISADQRRLVSIGSESLYVWDLLQRKLQWRRTGDGITCMALVPHCDKILCGLSDGRVVEMSLADGEIGRTIAVHGAAVTCLAVCSQRGRVASVGAYEQIIMSDLPSGTPIWSVSHPGSHIAIFSPSGEILVTSPLPKPYTQDRPPPPVLELRNVPNGDAVGSLAGHRETILGAAFANDNLLYSWSRDGTVRAWNVPQRKLAKIVTPALQSKLD